MPAQIGDVNAASAGGDLPVFDHDALVARGREAVFNEIRKGAFQIEYGCALLHHLCDRFASLPLFLACQRQRLRVGIGGVKVKGDGTNVFGIAGGNTYVAHASFVDLVDRHVEADVVRRGTLDVSHNGVVGVAADLVVALFVTVKAQKDQVGFGKINGKGAVGDYVDDKEAHLLCFDHEVS